jgi:hypothetical protein
MTDHAADGTVTLTITGRQLEPEPIPAAFLCTGTRSAATTPPGREPEDELLPHGMKPVWAIDVSPAARDTEATTRTLPVGPDHIVVLELADGGTLIANPARLKEALDRAGDSQLQKQKSLPDLDKLGPDTSAQRGAAAMLKGLISRITLLAVPDSDQDALLNAVAARVDPVQAGVTWLGTKVLMTAIEARLERHGLCRLEYRGGTPNDLAELKLTRADLTDPGASPLAPDTRLLVFIHGTGSSTSGSFGHLCTAEPELWKSLVDDYGEHIYGFEHRTLSQSPIENALDLVRSLPHGAHLSLVSHSRGGLVADLLCLADFGSQIENYSYPFPSPGTRDAHLRETILDDLRDAYEEQRGMLLKLACELRDRKLVIHRYARIASPANGTLLASGNFDVFLSGVLTLLGAVPFLYSSMLYREFRRAVIEIAKRRTDPHMVPGIEAMLPDSPLAQFLCEATVQPGIEMAVIAGDAEGGDMLSRLRVALTDFVLFDKEDNDLVVDTPAMLAGIAPRANARVLFERGSNVTHFRYFTNSSSRLAVRDWLLSPAIDKLDRFIALPEREAYATAMANATNQRGRGDAERLPIVVVLPDLMGSHLKSGQNRIWYPPLPDKRGLQLLELPDMKRYDTQATAMFDILYGKLCQKLADSHQVVPFPYDWRVSLEDLGNRLAAFLERFREIQVPVRFLAHGMGGLVVRACASLPAQDILKKLMERKGARIVMLGTPNHGTHSVVAELLGKGDGFRALWRLDVRGPGLRDLLATFASFPGLLSLLPSRDFAATAGMVPGNREHDYFDAQEWQRLSGVVSDRWFGGGCGATPSQALLDKATWLYGKHAELEQERAGTALPTGGADPTTIYVFGVAPSTPCALVDLPDQHPGMLATTAGDGLVTWESGRLPGVDSYYFMPARHGDLAATPEHFGAIAELLKTGATRHLSHEPPQRAAEKAGPVIYDAAPPAAADTEAVQRRLLGGSLRSRVPAAPLRRLDVTVRAMDLRFLSRPIMVGHYEQDPISGPEALIDRELLGGDLSKRYNLGQYAGPRGSATVVLRGANANERNARLSGAVVTGLGRYDGSLSASELTESARVGALRFLLQVMDVLGKDERELALGSLLLGFNSSANLSAAASVEALVRGVILANARFHERTGANIRIASLDIVELYLDTAIGAVYALRDLRERLKQFADKHNTELITCDELVSGEGMRQRLRDTAEASYWPRIIVTDADRTEETAAAKALAHDAEQAEPPIADRLRFMYVGSRARAETTVQQRQPSLIETLVRRQIASHKWDPEFGRMLYQLMVPHDFKDAARELDRLVLVVDDYTANLPWELMLAEAPPREGTGGERENMPLAVRASVVRQLSSLRYRPQVVQAMAYTALVIGNPSVQGFQDGFAITDGNAPIPLPGARDEALTIAQVLKKHSYDVEQLVGYEPGVASFGHEAATPRGAPLRLGPSDAHGTSSDTDAAHVLAALYRQPWRILHISGHGVFRLKHKDGRPRSGVLLSDGLLITAAEISAMEVVPELVFLNCCHTGQFDDGRQRNRLAASIARELIEIGVRCVLVAGWAVDDALAQHFGTCFYNQLLGQRKQFGEAVSAARYEVWDRDRSDLTWGAFQAYGDPGWTAESTTERADEPVLQHPPFAALEELLDALADARVRLAHQRDTYTEQDSALIAKRVDMLADNRCQPKWRTRPELHSALGATRRELNQIELAYGAFLRAAQLEDQSGRLTIRDIEQLADVEAQYGELCVARALAPENGKVPDETQLRQALERGEALLRQALGRVESLDRLSDAAEAADTAPEGDQAAPPRNVAAPNALRHALRGRIHRRMASVQARRLLVLSDDRIEDIEDAATTMEAQLKLATAAYRQAEGKTALGNIVPELALSRLALEALAGLYTTYETQGPAITFARLCGAHAADTGRSWDPAPALLRAKALLVETLVTGTLGDDGASGQASFDNVLQSYTDATRGVALKPSELDVIVSDIDALARLYRALSTRREGPDESWKRIARTREQIADNLRKLALRLQPARMQRVESHAAAGLTKPDGTEAAKHF